MGNTNKQPAKRAGIIPPRLKENIAQFYENEPSPMHLPYIDEMRDQIRHEQLIMPAWKEKEAPSPIQGNANPKTHDAENGYNTPGKLIWDENGLVVKDNKDPVVKQAHDWTGFGQEVGKEGKSFKQFLKEFYGLNSFDGRGADLITSVHVEDDWNNAAWDGNKILLGDGDKRLFQTFMLMDVIGHEWGHAVTQYGPNLTYANQSGALNEHLSDVRGILFLMYMMGWDASTCHWLIGKGIWVPRERGGVNGKSLRDMLHPGSAYDDLRLGGKDPQPATFTNYEPSSYDNGGVHIWSGPVNRVFALFANDIGGLTWKKEVGLGQIWHNASLTLGSESGFVDFYHATINTCKSLNPKLVTNLDKAWKQCDIDYMIKNKK